MGQRDVSPQEERCWILLVTTPVSLPAHCAELPLGGLQRAIGETGILSGMEPRVCPGRVSACSESLLLVWSLNWWFFGALAGNPQDELHSLEFRRTVTGGRQFPGVSLHGQRAPVHLL